MTVGELKRGDYFTLRDYDNQEVKSSKVWVRGDYVSGKRPRYSIHRFDDVCHERFVPADKQVFVDMIF